MAADLAKLAAYRDERHFESWDEFVDPELIAESEEALRVLCDHLLALGPVPDEAAARAAAEACVQRFNDLDGGEPWIMTIEREDIGERVEGAVELCGFDADDEGWLAGRDF